MAGACVGIGVRDGVEGEGAGGDDVVDVGAYVEGSGWVEGGGGEGACEERGVREALVEGAGEEDVLEEVGGVEGVCELVEDGLGEVSDGVEAVGG